MPASDESIELVRTINAPVAAVFSAWLDPALLVEWLATRAEVDPRIGGHYRLESDGGEDMPGLHVCRGEYLELIPNRRIVKSWIYEGPNPADTTTSRVSVDFSTEDEGTTNIHFREEGQGLGTDEERELSRRAWTAAFDELEQVLTA